MLNTNGNVIFAGGFIKCVMKVKGIIKKGTDGLYSIYTDNKIGHNRPGGFGETVDVAKEDFMDSIEESIEDADEDSEADSAE